MSNIFTTGTDTMRDGSEEQSAKVGFLKLQDGEFADVAMLTDMSGPNHVGYWQHFYKDGGKTASGACTRNAGKCLFCELGSKASWRGIIPVVVLRRYRMAKGKQSFTSQTAEVAMWAFGRTVQQSIAALLNRHAAIAAGETAGHVFSVGRSGSGLNTQYSVSYDKETIDVSGYDEPDSTQYIGPLSYGEQQRLFEAIGLLDGATQAGAISAKQVVAVIPNGSGKRAVAPAADPDPDETDWENIQF